MRQRPSCIVLALLVCSALSAAGCSGTSSNDDDDSNVPSSSGVPREKNLDELTAEEILRLCEWIVPQEGDPGPKECGDGNSLTTPTVEECTQNSFDVPCPVSLAEDCALSMNGDACMLFESTPCEAYLMCAESEQG